MRMVTIPKPYFENLNTVEFYGKEFRIPSHAEEYLALKYGGDWRMPKKDAPLWDIKSNEIHLTNQNI